MKPNAKSFPARKYTTLLGATGFQSHGYGMGGELTGWGECLILGVLGAMAGFLGGLMMSHVMRVAQMWSGRGMGGFSWTVAGALIGAVLFIGFGAMRDDGE